VKLRGFRIEPGEIEAALVAQAGVSQAAWSRGEDGRAASGWIGYVVGSAGAVLDRGAAAALCAATAGLHGAVALVVLERLPLTPNGKLDRRALPEPELAPSRSHRARRARRRRTILCGLFAEGAGAAIGRHRGQLLRAGRRQHRVDPAGEPGAAGGLSITPRAVFQHQTVARWRRLPVRRGACRLVRGRSGAAAVGVLPATPIMRWL
jgi:hypothetical protein